MPKEKVKLPLHYWDTCNFLTILKGDENGLQGCIDVLNEAEKGNLLIVTSSLTLASIIKIGSQKQPALPESEESRKIELFFSHEYIVIRELERKTAELSRRIAWDFGIKAFDAIHVATAIKSKVNYFETLDEGIIAKFQGQLNDPFIEVRKPQISVKQTELSFDDDE
ncbi:hypothetical protein Pse7367_1271 [Thalassoporum mexicanum PCC 7367]|uniref:type II toxin-antitoxin system VapC family toxin n=1 Tax=Thalassoporum mexicanum TaxID=3457544 RepID=UPI00029FB6C5|nr:PIN domain-containing protein [Pseudanabaena sp. PCC 7367]AFY69565.1 hypothetical protein Pse7367_1271 [Pseudanabaena sp. PCC 7367]